VGAATVPQFLQNFAPGFSAAPHWRQASAAKATPQLLQNLAPSFRAAPQCLQNLAIVEISVTPVPYTPLPFFNY